MLPNQLGSLYLSVLIIPSLLIYFQIISEDDLTGAWIKGSSPLVVISGDTATINTSQSFVWNDHFEEQLSPTKSWGRSFATVPFSGGMMGDVFRIIGNKVSFLKCCCQFDYETEIVTEPLP